MGNRRQQQKKKMEREIEDMISGIMSQSEPGPFMVSDMLQNIIYFFNQSSIRDHVIQHYLKLLPQGRHVIWDGTYYFDEKGKIDPYYHPEHPNMTLDQFVKERPVFHATQGEEKQFIIFTCCILYEENKVHYLAFIYRTGAHPILISFDPGIHLYTKGQDVLVPLIRDAFFRAGLIPSRKAIERVGLCRGKYFDRQFGIQYEGSDPSTNDLPADSFCQSWTLFFLIEFLRHKCSDRFVATWCKVYPDYREAFVLLYYFMPWLQQDPFVYKEWLKFYPDGDRLPDLLAHIIQSLPSHGKKDCLKP